MTEPDYPTTRRDHPMAEPDYPMTEPDYPTADSVWSISPGGNTPPASSAAR